MIRKFSKASYDVNLREKRYLYLPKALTHLKQLYEKLLIGTQAFLIELKPRLITSIPFSKHLFNSALMNLMNNIFKSQHEVGTSSTKSKLYNSALINRSQHGWLVDVRCWLLGKDFLPKASLDYHPVT